MQRILKALAVAFASLGLALGSASALAQKAETPKDSAKKAETAPKAETKKADTKASDAKAAPSGALIDINSASEKELASLNGIGDVRAKAIVKNRPYKGKNELKDRKIIPDSVYAGIQDKIIAKQDTAAAAPKKDDKSAPKKTTDEKKK
jgi:competence protein ComEA